MFTFEILARFLHSETAETVVETAELAETADMAETAEIYCYRFGHLFMKLFRIIKLAGSEPCKG